VNSTHERFPRSIAKASHGNIGFRSGINLLNSPGWHLTTIQALYGMTHGNLTQYPLIADVDACGSHFLPAHSGKTSFAVCSLTGRIRLYPSMKSSAATVLN
jgi:hypothetical protein